jgi:hypothetical protein
MRFKSVAAVFVLVVAGSVSRMAAHHSAPMTFDVSKEITIQGVVTNIEWMNPHTRFWVDVRNDDGAISTWELESAPPNTLKRTVGLDFIKVRDQVTVVLWQAKDGAKLGHTLTVSFPDGRVFNSSRREITAPK